MEVCFADRVKNSESSHNGTCIVRFDYQFEEKLFSLPSNRTFF